MPLPKCACGKKLTKLKNTRCADCYNLERTTATEGKRKPCDICGEKMNRRAVHDRCSRCIVSHGLPPSRLVRVIVEEANVAPTIPARPQMAGSAIVATDMHIPWHDPDVLVDLCKTATILGIRTLIIGGDLLHADVISKYLGVGKSVPITKEIEACGRVLGVLEEVFDHITVIPGNHDARFERMIAGLRETKLGRQGLEMVAKLLGADDPDDAEDVSLRYLRHFLGSDKITWHPLPDLELNGTWLIQHPGSVSRIAPQNERAMVRKFRKSVIQGHSHLWGVGLDESGTDVAFNCGHCADDTKWRYVREKPSTFPKSVKGYAVIYTTPDNPGGRLIPVAVHDRLFRISDIAEMLRASL